MAGNNRFSDIGGGGKWLRLKKENDECRVMFILDEEDEELGAVFYRMHYVNGGYHECTRKNSEPKEMCAWCPTDKGSWRMAMTVYDLDSNERKVLDGFPGMWFGDLKDVLEEWDWKNTAFKIKRKGEKAQTRRSITPIQKVPEDAKVAAAMLEVYAPSELHEPKREDTGPVESVPMPEDDDAPF